MIVFENAKQDIADLKSDVEDLAYAINIDKLKADKKDLEAEQATEGFWNDLEKAQIVNQKLARVDNKLDRFNKINSRVEDAELLLDLCMDGGSEEDGDMLDEELKSLKKDMEALKLETLLRGKYDANNAILTLHSGAGGTEAQDWASMLYRMYTRYAERVGYKVNVLDKLDGDEAGIKSITFEVIGENAYGYLKAEKGVHRLVRISPFDSNARRHTSFASLEVMPEVENDTTLNIRPEDLKIDTYRSGGAGGQHVNKTDSAVRITHLPTGIVVQCQNERSQIQNREQAMKMLTSKLLERQEQERIEKEQALKGDIKKIEWGSQIRSYVFCPYTMVKDHRTGFETGNIAAVMDGDIEGFIVDYLKKSN